MKLYLSLTIIFLLSFAGALFLPVNDLFKGIFATPAVIAMIGALFQLARDHAAHESKLDLQRKQQIFNLGATSHMANVTFDKHVEFCEKYMDEVVNTVETLYREGTTTEASEHAKKLFDLRRKYSAWITEEIGNQLTPFEKSLREIAAWQGYIEKTPDDKPGRHEKIEYLNEIFSKVLNLGSNENNATTFITEEMIKKRVRQILQIEDLVRLRAGLIDEACSYIGKI